MRGARLIGRVLSVVVNFLVVLLFFWSSKKQNSVALLTAEAEYISAGSCCAQLLWMKQTLLDFGVKFDEILLLCDNESVVKLQLIWCNIQEPSILISIIISLEIM